MTKENSSSKLVQGSMAGTENGCMPEYIKIISTCLRAFARVVVVKGAGNKTGEL